MVMQRTWFFVLVVGGSFIGGILAYSGFADRDNDVSKVIRAETFQIVDSGGKTRIQLGMSQDFPLIRLFDKQGDPSVWIIGSGGTHPAEGGMAAIAMLSKANESSIRLGLEHYGCPVVRLSHGTGDTLLGLGVDPDGSPSIRLAKKDGTCHIGLKVEPDGSPSIKLFDKSQRPFDKEEKVIWSAP